MKRACSAACALVITAFLGASAAIYAHPHDPPTPEYVKQIQSEVLAFRDQIKKAIESKDVDKLRQFYADSFTHTHGSGKMDGKDARIVSMLAADPAIETAPAEELNFRVFGSDTVVLTGRSPILNKVEGRHYDFRWMAVYVRVDGHWHLAASQSTRLPSLTN